MGKGSRSASANDFFSSTSASASGEVFDDALRNDYKVLTAKIDENLQVLHSARLTKVAPLVTKSSASQVSTMDEDLVSGVPFVMVEEITDDSPAAEDGLQLGDQIIKFGNVGMGDEVVRRLASEAQSNEGLVIMRQGSSVNLTITPRQWHGRGLLGYYPFYHGIRLEVLGLPPTEFQISKSFKPFDQLMVVLPPRSSNALPKAYRNLMTSEDSTLIKFYPQDYVVDTDGKRFPWQDGATIQPATIY